MARAARMSADALTRLLVGDAPSPRGKKLVRLAEAFSTSVAYLIGLDPDAPVPNQFLEEDQGALGLLAGDEESLLRAYRRLDVSSRAAFLKMSPELEIFEKKPRSVRSSD